MILSSIMQVILETNGFYYNLKLIIKSPASLLSLLFNPFPLNGVQWTCIAIFFGNSEGIIEKKKSMNNASMSRYAMAVYLRLYLKKLQVTEFRR